MSEFGLGMRVHGPGEAINAARLRFGRFVSLPLFYSTSYIGLFF